MVIGGFATPLLNKLFPAAVAPTVGKTAEPADPQESVALGKPQQQKSPSPHWIPRPNHWPGGLLGAVAVAICAAGSAAEFCSRRPIGQIHRPHCDSPMHELPAVTLDKPVVLVPGFHTPFEAFDHLTQKLVEGGTNGGQVYYAHQGNIYTDHACKLKATQEDLNTAKVFVVQMLTRQDQPAIGACEVRQDLEAIRTGTGADKVDAVGYSMGGLATRVYLDHGGKDIDRFMMVGTPNHGSAMADTTIGLLNLRNEGWDTNWLLARKPITSADRGALAWLRSDMEQNVNLTELNQNWDRQREQVSDIRIVGSESKWTVTLDGLAAGDGTVTKESLTMPDVEVHMLPGKQFTRHGQLFENPDLYGEMTDFFGWKPCS